MMLKSKLKTTVIILLAVVALETSGFAIYADSKTQQIADYGKEILKYKSIIEDYTEQIEEYDRETELLRKKCVLPVNTISQKPELPNGCEITSATILLNYFDIFADKLDMAYNYLPRGIYYLTDPNEAYMGDPGTNYGYYCFEKPIIKALNDYLSENGIYSLKAIDIKGSDSDTLREYIRQGYPVIFWATVGFRDIRFNYNFTLPNGEYPYTGLHCMVLSGYDSENMYISDPLGKNSAVSRERFDEIYNGMGQHAVTIIKTK